MPPNDDVPAVGVQCGGVGWYREVGEVAFHHAPEPASLLVDRCMPVLAERLLDLPDLGPHSFWLRLAPELEAGAVLLSGAIVPEPQEIERLRLAIAPSLSTFGSKLAELDEASLFRVQTQCELSQAFLKITLEAFRVLPILEANDRIVRM